MTGSLAASVTELISLSIIITRTLNHLNDFGLTVAALVVLAAHNSGTLLSVAPQLITDDSQAGLMMAVAVSYQAASDHWQCQ